MITLQYDRLPQFVRAPGSKEDNFPRAKRGGELTVLYKMSQGIPAFLAAPPSQTTSE